MATPQDVAQLIVSSLVIADPNDSRVPVGHGVLDRALKTAADEKLLPEWAIEALHFANTRVGMRCVELTDILGWAQFAELTSTPNPSYQYVVLQVNERTAARLLQWIEVPEEQARSIGQRLRAIVKAELTQQPELLSA